MRFRLPLLAASAAAIMTVSSPAQAALSIDLTTGAVTAAPGGLPSGPVVVGFDGFGGTPAALISGLSATLGLTLTSFTGTSAVFNYTVSNTSSLDSRVSIFGFNTNPDITSATATGVFAGANAGPGNVPNFGNVEVCFGGNSCSGGGGGGVDDGSSGGGTFTLNFASSNNITLSNFYVRYQSITGAGNVTSAIGRQTPPVPEPGTWAMMLLGFGAVGFAMRRTRNVRAQLKGGLPQLA